MKSLRKEIKLFLMKHVHNQMMIIADILNIYLNL